MAAPTPATERRTRTRIQRDESQQGRELEDQTRQRDPIRHRPSRWNDRHPPDTQGMYYLG